MRRPLRNPRGIPLARRARRGRPVRRRSRRWPWALLLLLLLALGTWWWKGQAAPPPEPPLAVAPPTGSKPDAGGIAKAMPKRPAPKPAPKPAQKTAEMADPKPDAGVRVAEKPDAGAAEKLADQAPPASPKNDSEWADPFSNPPPPDDGKPDELAAAAPDAGPRKAPPNATADAATLRAAITARSGELRVCATDPSGERVHFRLMLGRDGKVRNLTLSEVTRLPAPVAACLRDKIRRWVFNELALSNDVEVLFTYSLNPDATGLRAAVQPFGG